MVFQPLCPAMFRRLCALMLMLACALAPAMPTHGDATEPAQKDCGCGRACCGDRECAPPAPNPVRATAPTTLASVEQRVNVSKPAKRIALVAFARILAESTPAALPTRLVAPARIVPADSAALFE